MKSPTFEGYFSKLLVPSYEEVIVDLLRFQKIDTFTKKGVTVKRLEPIKSVNIGDIIEFFNAMLPKIVNHRNHLKHYNNTIDVFCDSFDALFIDFSENLSLPVKFEPQSLHWHKTQVSVHSGIMKIHGEKSYHPYVSNDRKYDQKFVKLVLKEMLDTVDMLPGMCIISSSQYKSAQHFDDMQIICGNIKVPIIRLFSVAGHGQGEVDHIGGLAKVAIRRHIGAGGIVLDAKDCLNFLRQKFEDKMNPKFYLKEISTSDLNQARAESCATMYPTIEESTRFQVIIFKPNSTFFKAAPYICVCEECMIDYGSCSLFQTCLRSELQEPEQATSVSSNDFNDSDFIVPNTYCAIAAGKSSSETFWLIQIIGSQEAETSIPDDYANNIPAGHHYIVGQFLEKDILSAKGIYYEQQKKITYFFVESVIYPFVQVQETKKGLLLTNDEYVTVLNYVEETGYSHI